MSGCQCPDLCGRDHRPDDGCGRRARYIRVPEGALCKITVYHVCVANDLNPMAREQLEGHGDILKVEPREDGSLRVTLNDGVLKVQLNNANDNVRISESSLQLQTATLASSPTLLASRDAGSILLRTLTVTDLTHPGASWTFNRASVKSIEVDNNRTFGDTNTIISTSSLPSRGSATPTSAPPPNAPVTATITCQAPPSYAGSSSTRTEQRRGDSVAAARSAPSA